MNILLANPRGFCAGVERAIEIVESALHVYGPPVYVRHEVVHNRYVIDGLKRKGVVVVEELSQVPDGATVIFSAHGVAKSVRNEARNRRLRILDATCPLVTKVHLEVERFCREGREVVLIGHRGHAEVEGTLGHYESSPRSGIHLIERREHVAELEVRNSRRLGYVTQTTLSVDDTADIVAALQKRFPRIVGPRKSDICYATQNRQDAVKRLAERCDLILVVGSRNSSNSTRLRDIAKARGVEAYLIDAPEQIESGWLRGKHTVGVTAGASAPECLVRRVLTRLEENGAVSCAEDEGIRESVVFVLPRELRNAKTFARSLLSIRVSAGR